jgi:glycosyltransferase involved in cell wall biosynthesis
MSGTGKKRIAVIAAGHLSTCPRMLKAADALAEQGHDVHVVSTRATPWASEADAAVLKRRRDSWRWSVVDYAREGAPVKYVVSGVKRRLAAHLAGYRSTVSFSVATAALSRVHDDLVRAALATNADFFYGGTVGALAATFEAATQAGRDYALDLEDFYSGEHPNDVKLTRVIERVETETLGGARFLTAASAGIADAYRATYGVAPVVIHNTFPLPSRPPGTAPTSGALKLYWFSQTIGPGRGLEDVVEAMRRSGVPIELHLRGHADEDFVARLQSLVSERLVVHAPAPPDEMVELLADFDVGLATEQGASVNREICLTNKALTYMLGGLALVMTETAGHRPLLDTLGEASLHYAPGDVDALATGLTRFADDRDFLERCRRASWEAANQRWHWEHEEERGRLVRLFAPDS